jgi:hypothetical protein
MKKRQSRSERGDNVSVCSPSANVNVPPPPGPLVASVPLLHSQLTNEMAPMREGAGMFEQQATFNSSTSQSMGMGKGRAVSLGTNQQFLYPRSSSILDSGHGRVATEAIPIPMGWQGLGPTSAPWNQQMSGPIDQDQPGFTQHPASFPSMQHGFGTTQHDQSMHLGFSGVDHSGLQASSFSHDPQIWSSSSSSHDAFNPMYDVNVHGASSFMDSATSSYVEQSNMLPSSYVEPSNMPSSFYAQPSEISFSALDVPFGTEFDMDTDIMFDATSFQAMNEQFDQG